MALPEIDEELPIAEVSTAIAQVATTYPTQALSTEIEGFTAPVVDFTSFPIVVQKDGIFKIDDVPFAENEFDVVVLGDRDQYVVSLHGATRDDPDIVFYSPDGVHTENGDVIANEAREHIAKGYTMARPKPYKVVMAKMLSADNEYEGQFVQLQIPDKSRGSYGGYRIVLAANNQDIRQSVTRVYAGPLIGKGKKAFNPWKFKYAGAM